MAANNDTTKMLESLARIEANQAHMQADITELKGGVTAIDDRLRTVEQRSARNSAGIAAFVGIGVSLVTYSLKTKLGL